MYSKIFFSIFALRLNLFLQLVRKFSIIIILSTLFISSCDLRPKLFKEEESEPRIEVQRYDRLESNYLTTGDFSALQQMQTNYPMETRTLIENVLKIGSVNDSETNKKLLSYFQDSTLQIIIGDAEATYANIDDINRDLKLGMENLCKMIPDLEIPKFYASIGSLDHSIVVSDNSVGIFLDKYLGQNYPLYKKFGYTDQQLTTMNRDHIVPDCLSFYLISLYPMEDFENATQEERDKYMGKIMWICNSALNRKFFRTAFVDMVERYMHKHPNVTVVDLLKMNEHQAFK